MAAKLKKRLSENKLLKLDKLELKDVICSICQSILIEPVTLPCFHDFCQRCFNGSIENNALCCPLCRLRIGSWLRTTTKQKNLVNIEFWNFIKSKFSKEIQIKLRGEDIDLPDEKPVLRLSVPGEIRLEYEAELERLKAERLAIEYKHLKETEELIKKLQQEEEEAHQHYLESLKQDEILAQQIQEENLKTSTSTVVQNPNMPIKRTKPKLKPTKIDSYLTKIKTPISKSSPVLTDDNSSQASTPKVASAVNADRPSPEMIPSYGKILKSLIDKKLKFGTRFWNKENGYKKTEPVAHSSLYDAESLENSCEKKKNGLKSLLVSLPLPASRVPQCSLNKNTNPDKLKRTGRIDSMLQELCYFKPIETTTHMSNSTCKGLPIHVPCVRVDEEARSSPHALASPPSRAQYLQGLCHLRRTSLASNLPSAFVINLNILKDTSSKNSLSYEFKNNRNSRYISPVKRKNSVKQMIKNDTHTESVQLGEDSCYAQTRTRSMGSIKDENETTPKKTKMPNRKAVSDKKPYLRSDSKKMEYEKRLNRSPLFSNNINKHRVNLTVKKLSSSPLQNNDFNKILQDQLRIEKMIEQEKSDLALAKKMEAEWNGRRQSTRNIVKRQVSFHYSLRPVKKIKV